ncbi:MAG: FKBP-type peptidyl-prolyl cis-trans isomerase [Sulfuricella sp.]|nr:FKBP-type peptidyl-prolyl cis-trans isomerase [Sulfuricella sp.]
MKLKWTIAVGWCLLAGQAGADEAPAFANQTDKTSYGLGVEMARNFKKQDIAIDPDLLLQGLNDGLSGQRLRVPEKELRQTMTAFQSEVRQKMVLSKRVAALDNKQKGEAFLAENKARDGVITLPSGVQYKIVKAGDGKTPSEADMVECRYRGTLLDGSEFDATEPGKSANLKVAALIPGWRDALKLMPAGSQWQIFIPPQQAYGERGVGSDIGPNETLLFDVELLAVK